MFSEEISYSPYIFLNIVTCYIDIIDTNAPNRATQKNLVTSCFQANTQIQTSFWLHKITAYSSHLTITPWNASLPPNLDRPCPAGSCTPFYRRTPWASDCSVRSAPSGGRLRPPLSPRCIPGNPRHPDGPDRSSHATSRTLRSWWKRLLCGPENEATEKVCIKRVRNDAGTARGTKETETGGVY